MTDASEAPEDPAEYVDRQSIDVTVIDHDECCSNRERVVFHGISNDDDSRFVRFVIEPRYADTLIGALHRGEDPVAVVFVDEIIAAHNTTRKTASSTPEQTTFEEAARAAMSTASQVSVTPQLKDYEENVLVTLGRMAVAKKDLDMARDRNEPDMMKFAEAFRLAQMNYQRASDNAVEAFNKES